MSSRSKMITLLFFKSCMCMAETPMLEWSRTHWPPIHSVEGGAITSASTGERTTAREKPVITENRNKNKEAGFLDAMLGRRSWAISARAPWSLNADERPSVLCFYENWKEWAGSVSEGGGAITLVFRMYIIAVLTGSSSWLWPMMNVFKGVSILIYC